MASKGEVASYVLGIDLGTTTVKVVLIDSKTCTTVQELSRKHEATVHNDIGSVANEQDPDKILTSLQFCVSSLPKDKLMKVKKIGVAGQMHGVIFWSKHNGWESNSFGRFEKGSGTSNLITWQDGRCSPEFIKTLPTPDCHLRLSTGHGCATMFWLARNKPECLSCYDCAGTIQDYVVAMLCNLAEPVMSIHNAASWGYYNTAKTEWNKALLESASFPTQFLPKVVAPGQVAGELHSNWYCIPVGTEVGAALGDLQSSVYSSLQQDHDAVLNLSTSAQVAFQMHDGFSPDGSEQPCSVEYFPYINGRYIAVAASLTGGNVLAAFVKMLQQWTHELGLGVPENKIWEKIISLGKECSESDLDICPTVFGERHAPDQRATVSNITTLNINLGSTYRALCKGIVTNLHTMMSQDFLSASGIQRIVGSGSALKKNVILQQEIEHYYNLPIMFGECSDAALGVARVMISNN